MVKVGEVQQGGPGESNQLHSNYTRETQYDHSLCIPSELPTPLQFLAVKAALYLGVSLTDSLTGTD